MTTALRCTTNTTRIEREIRRAFREFSSRRQFTTVFEHDAWWVLCSDGDDELIYAVNDATGPGTYDGFSFERC